MIQKSIFLILILISNLAMSSDDIATIGLGMANVGFAESETSIEEEENTGEGVEAIAGSISVLTTTINYETPTSLNRTVFYRLNVPIVGSGDSTYLSASIGMNYFFNQIATDKIALDRGTKLTIAPKFRYYVGGQIGSAFFVYTTDTKKKSDVSIEIGGQAGMLYSLGERYGIHAEFFFGRGVGVNTTSSNIKGLVAFLYKL